MLERFRRQYKLCLVGDGYVGKTSIRRKYLKEGFKASYLPTLGVDFAQKALTHDGVPTNLVIWDIAGQPAFQGLRKRYYEGSSAILLVYSVVDRNSFDNASKWLVEAHGFMGSLPPMIVMGNKIDLRSGKPTEEVVTPEEGKAFTEKMSQKLNTPSIFIETSALTGENIDEAFDSLIGMLFERQAKEEGVSAPPTGAPRAVVSEEESVDPVTLLKKDSLHLQEEQIGRSMNELVKLRTELKNAEEELADTVSKLETSLLNLKNAVHVKRIMYEHLQQQLRQTRQEWSDAYDEYMKLDKQKKTEIEKRTKQIDDIRSRIENVGRIIRTRVGDLDMKKMTNSSD
ncbi:MAG: GTP-binding protein [Candidatus Thorarchaeota archaeon]|nr:GTP-binding protein [Candidatus Thorarchaeota archaeon]